MKNESKDMKRESLSPTIKRLKGPQFFDEQHPCKIQSQHIQNKLTTLKNDPGTTQQNGKQEEESYRPIATLKSC